MNDPTIPSDPIAWGADAEKIVRDYLGRLERLLRGLPADDRREVITEVRSHIHESYCDDTTPDPIDRILHVLSRLGDPAQVAAESVSPALVRMGWTRRLPFYVGAGVLLVLAGIPVGLVSVALIVSVLLLLGILVVTYFATAVSLTALGMFGIAITLLKYTAPNLLLELSRNWGIREPDFGNLSERFVLSLFLAGIGVFLLWVGRYLMRGLGLCCRVLGTRVRSLRRRRAVGLRRWQAAE